MSTGWLITVRDAMCPSVAPPRIVESSVDCVASSESISSAQAVTATASPNFSTG